MSMQEKVREEVTKWVGPRPLTFAQFLELYEGKDLVEPIDGVVVSVLIRPALTLASPSPQAAVTGTFPACR